MRASCRLVAMAPPSTAYRVMRKVWPHLPWSVRRRLGRRPAPAATGDPVGILATVDLEATVRRLQRDGVAPLGPVLPAATVEHLRRLAHTVPAAPGADGEPVVVVDPDALTCPRYDLQEPDLLADEAVQALLVDPSLRRLADAYLGGEAINDMAAMWWSVAQPGGPSAAAAQQFHTDRDRLSFLKFFVYLTDVDDDHGPHVFVRGSHRRLPARLRADRRFTDDEVIDAFGASALVRLTGPAGTVFAADTGGLHKGLPPRLGHRLVFQVEFATSLFGAPFVQLDPAGLAPDVRALAEARPRAYGRLLAV